MMLYIYLINSMMVFSSLFIDQRKTYNYYSTLSFTSNQLYGDFGREGSKNFTEMSQKIESMVSLFPSVSTAFAINLYLFLGDLASMTPIQLILHIFEKWEGALPERYKTKLTVHDLGEYVLQG